MTANRKNVQWCEKKERERIEKEQCERRIRTSFRKTFITNHHCTVSLFSIRYEYSLNTYDEKLNRHLCTLVDSACLIDCGYQIIVSSSFVLNTYSYSISSNDI